MDKERETAERIACNLLKDKKWMHEHHLREMAKSDWTSSLNHAKEKGEERGLKKAEAMGKKIAIAKIAMNLKKMGLPMELISESTGLSKNEIKKL
ncbi:hypothetical protein [Methanobrevibacter filiformis]|uniref:PD-(D/E)XK nuclease family transposase n=1 Tax=Methanobrevibacter filiformis TaxID=55758 RepID=A0A165Z6Q0_9EURY|nr:hypothetical protein [Methanobrevibacter filiformis]KZX10314.1 hypothetical protein MBFIL_18120 [Methanobrevibacter filiformis]